MSPTRSARRLALSPARTTLVPRHIVPLSHTLHADCQHVGQRRDADAPRYPQAGVRRTRPGVQRQPRRRSVLVASSTNPASRLARGYSTRTDELSTTSLQLPRPTTKPASLSCNLSLLLQLLLPQVTCHVGHTANTTITQWTNHAALPTKQTSSSSRSRLPSSASAPNSQPRSRTFGPPRSTTAAPPPPLSTPSTRRHSRPSKRSRSPTPTMSASTRSSLCAPSPLSFSPGRHA